MRSLSAVVALALAFTSVLGAPTELLTIKKFAGQVKPGSFIVKLKASVDKASHLSALSSHLGESLVTHNYDSDFLNAFAGNFSMDALNTLRASPDVEFIEEVRIYSVLASIFGR
jgi:cerevisin